MKKGNVWALLPIGVFLVIYLGLGIVFEYVLKIGMGFYSIPIVVAFLVALFVACIQNRKVKLDESLIFPAFELRHSIFLSIHFPYEGVAVQQSNLRFPFYQI